MSLGNARKEKICIFNSAANGKAPVKRSSEGGCTCKTTCQKTRCGCRKMNLVCGSYCKCESSICENRENENGFPLNPENSQEAVKKPRYLENEEGKPRVYKNKSKLFFKTQL
ncbi:hypothetical protein NQ315_006643 [Exocentrus adspersus]|uniref:Tesmin/TSO1-like CXC domain-containing protein n=1 Tax=Exocentrus adspersus TaxID=1586481 RepID=A0AAV8VE31_9CUCU|nr:hypothetical protein NQ315_006643 [Exocentrus adspersus]